jgi:hypothetical protein
MSYCYYMLAGDVVLRQKDLSKVALADGANVCVALDLAILASVRLLLIELEG